jgi:hypothetical protein
VPSNNEHPPLTAFKEKEENIVDINLAKNTPTFIPSIDILASMLINDLMTLRLVKILHCARYARCLTFVFSSGFFSPGAGSYNDEPNAEVLIENKPIARIKYGMFVRPTGKFILTSVDVTDAEGNSLMNSEIKSCTFQAKEYSCVDLEQDEMLVSTKVGL